VANAQPLEGANRPPLVDDRRFGYWVGHFVVVGSMIGAGILTTSGLILRDNGNPAALLGLWVVGGLIALCGAVTVAELATSLPRTGGDYVFVREAFGPGAGFVSGWATFILGFAAPSAVLANLSITYLTSPFTSSLNEALPAGMTRLKLTDQVFVSLKSANVPETVLEKLNPLKNKEFSQDDLVGKIDKLLNADETQQFQSLILNNAARTNLAIPIGASALILLIGLTHTLGHRHSSRLQLAATILTAAILITLAGGGILFGRGDWNHFLVGGWPTGNQWQQLATGLIYVGFAYGGWNGAGYLAGEIRNPSWTLPRCLIGGASTVMVLYLLVNVAYVYALDPIEMMSKTEDEVKPVANLAVTALFGSAAANAVSMVLGLGLMATVSASLLTGPRIAYAMAQDGAFPGYAGRLHATRRTPVAATLTQVVVAIGLVWAGSFRELLDYAAIGFVAISGLTVASVFPIRRRTDLPHPYRLWLYPLPPLAYLILIGWTIGNALMPGDQQKPALYSLGTILIGIPLARLLRKPKGENKS
jgi:amino acid transporter